MRPTLIKPIESAQPDTPWGRLRARTIWPYLAGYFGGQIAAESLMAAGIAHGTSPFGAEMVRMFLWITIGASFYLLLRLREIDRRLGRPNGAIPIVLLTTAACMILPTFNTQGRSDWVVPQDFARSYCPCSGMSPMIGTWTGHFGGDPALLAIDSQDGPVFQGVLLDRASNWTYRVRFWGIIRDDGSVFLQESRVLDEPYGGDWALGQDLAFVSSPFFMHGRGIDPRGEHYRWGFVHNTDSVILPSN